MILTPIPATIITGFLGAGKTSLLRHLIMNANGRRLALIINEFGDLGVDGALLSGCGIAECRDEDIVELTNGCLCCTVADDFLPTIEALLDRDVPPDHILIETSGLALPKPLIKAFSWPEIRARSTVDGVIAVIDTVATIEGRFAQDPQKLQAARAADPTLDHETPLAELFAEQLQSADLVILNKSDLLDESDLQCALTLVTGHLRPAVKAVRAKHGQVDPRLLLGLDAAAEGDLDTRLSHHDDDDTHDHDDFESFVLKLDPISDLPGLEVRLRSVIERHDILRVKGLLHIIGRDMRCVLHAVGTRLEHRFDRPWRQGESRQNALVIIGHQGLDEAAVRAGLSAD